MAKSSSNWCRVGAAVERSFRSCWSNPPAQSGKSGVIIDSAYTVQLTPMLAFFLMTMLKNTQLPPEYQRLRRKLSNIGWIALGSLVERDKPGQGGPRYQWSRRLGPKTVTVALSPEQFGWLKQAISNQREVWDILMQLQQLTAQHALENIPGPPRRKRLSKKRLGLN